MEHNKATLPDHSDGVMPRPPRKRVVNHAPAGSLTAVSDTVRAFLVSELGAREVRVTRVFAMPGGDAGWETEAEVLVPDLAIKTLGLPLTQEVLERRGYAVTVDQSLSVIGYSPLDLDG